MVIANGVYADYGVSLGASAVSNVVFGVLGLILMTMYYCRSVRVRKYMGSTEYQQRALFRIGMN